VLDVFYMNELRLLYSIVIAGSDPNISVGSSNPESRSNPSIPEISSSRPSSSNPSSSPSKPHHLLQDSLLFATAPCQRWVFSAPVEERAPSHLLVTVAEDFLENAYIKTMGNRLYNSFCVFRRRFGVDFPPPRGASALCRFLGGRIPLKESCPGGRRKAARGTRMRYRRDDTDVGRVDVAGLRKLGVVGGVPL